jgi:hypothetical protein
VGLFIKAMGKLNGKKNINDQKEKILVIESTKKRVIELNIKNCLNVVKNPKF